MKKKPGLLAALLVCLTSGISADTPLVAVTSPSGTVFSASFPFTLPFSFNVTHHEVRNLNVLDVQVNGTSIFTNEDAIGNPFSGPGNTNACSSGMKCPGFIGERLV